MNRIAKQRGMTLVELMVSMVLGLFLMIGATSVYTQGRQNYQSTEIVARIQENIRFAFEVLEADIRLSGFWGQHNIGSSTTVSGVVVLCDGNNVTAWALAPTNPVQATNNVPAASNANVGPNCSAFGDGVVPNTDVLVVRHNQSGAVKLLSEKVNCSVINAGDGSHEHPTQALLDALTIRRRRGKLAGLTVAICGDIQHSRVARSNIYLLTTMGARVRLIGPRTLVPCTFAHLGAEIFHDMNEGLKDCDIVMMLRLQTERMHSNFFPSVREYFQYFGLDYEKLSNAKEDALIMHPGPMNRGVEIDSEVADDIGRSAIREQVEMGVAVRMACLEILTRESAKAQNSAETPNPAGAKF